MSKGIEEMSLEELKKLSPEEHTEIEVNTLNEMDAWAKKEKGYDSYQEWYLDNMD